MTELGQLPGRLVACVSGARPVLTAYPTGYTLNDVRARRVTLLCPTKFGDDGFLRQTGRLLRTPAPAPLVPVGSRLQFRCGGRPDWGRAVARTSFLFFGEEITMAARLWTHGFDCYAPPQAVVYHLWTRDHRPNFATASGRRAEAGAGAGAGGGGGRNDDWGGSAHLGGGGVTDAEKALRPSRNGGHATCSGSASGGVGRSRRSSCQCSGRRWGHGDRNRGHRLSGRRRRRRRRVTRERQVTRERALLEVTHT